MSNETLELEGELLATLLSDEVFLPTQPRTLKETGLAIPFIETLVLKYVATVGTASGRNIAGEICLSFGLLEEVLQSLRTRQLVVHAGAAPFNDYYYGLTEEGNSAARRASRASAYVGPAPVPLDDYIVSVDAQTISAESPRREQLEAAFRGITVNPDLLDLIGPAVNSGAGMFLYGAPGNGKSTLAHRITQCFGREIWIPHAVIDSDEVIKVFDPSYHQEAKDGTGGLIKMHEYDRRWIRVRRPTVVVGGELTMDGLEIRHDPSSRVSEAPLQMKSNCGCLVIDDFGRQRIAPAELLNRWIVPLESGYDFLTLATGKKIRVPFQQLIIFSTNLEPCELVDEAFLRRIPYKIEVGDPDEAEFHQLFRIYAEEFGCDYQAEVVEHLIAEYFLPLERPLRRCHPRDLLKQLGNYCRYHAVPFEMHSDYIDRVAGSYFTMVVGKPRPPQGCDGDLLAGQRVQ
jgi:predicted ATPase with chaperone activity